MNACHPPGGGTELREVLPMNMAAHARASSEDANQSANPKSRFADPNEQQCKTW